MVALVDGLLDAMVAKGSADLIADLAAAVPVEVIGNLLAVPRAERGPLRDWSLAILGALEPVISEEQRERGERAVRGQSRLSAPARRRPPRIRGDPSRDVLTRLIRAKPTASGFPSANCCTTSSSFSMPATRPPPT